MVIQNILSIFKKKPIKILVLVGGNKTKIEEFIPAASELQLDVTTASFSELVYDSFSSNFTLKIGEVDLKEFTHIYIRMVGMRLEDATLVANYAKKNRIKIFDPLYKDSLLMPSSLGKSVEMMKIISKDAGLPKTIFGSLEHLKNVAEKHLGFPFVIKSTTGKKAREVWSPETKKDMKVLFGKLSELEKEGSRFFAQEFINASERVRVFVLGDRALAAIVRPTKWRKRLGSEGRKMVMSPIPEEYSEIAVKAAKACGLIISGVDVVKDEKTGRLYILEANAAPVWKALSHDTGVNIEKEILSYISKQ